MQLRQQSSISEAQDAFVTELWVKQVSNALAKKFNVKVHKGKTWGADVEKGVLTYGPEIYLLTHNEALGLLTHEIAHLRETRAPKRDTVLAKEKPVLWHEGVNTLEDRRIEYIMGKEFPGGKEALALLNRTMTNRIRDIQGQLSTAMGEALQEVNSLRAERNEPPITAEEMTRDWVNWDKLQASGTQDEVQRANDVRNLAYNHGMPSVLTQVLIEATLQYEGEQPTQDYWNKEMVQRATVIADKMKRGKIEQMKSTQEIADFWKKEIVPLVQEYFTTKQEQQQQGSSVSASDDHGKKPDGKPEYSQRPMSERIRKQIGEIQKARGEEKEETESDGFSYKMATVLLRDQIRLYGYKLQRVLKDNMFDRTGGKHLSGKLDTRKLYKHRMGNMRLFKRKVESDKKDFAFAIITDISSSMRHQMMYKVARDAMVVLNEVLAFCGVPTGVWAFNWNTYQAKGFNEPTDNKKFSHVFRGATGGTDIVEAYKHSVPSLMATERKNKIHICLTDGGVNRLDIEQVNEIRNKNPSITYYGIGIKEDLSELFPRDKWQRIESSDELMPAVMRILRKHIIG